MAGVLVWLEKKKKVLSLSSIGHGHYADLMEAAVVKDDSHGWEFTSKYQDSVVTGDLRSLNIDIYDVFLSDGGETCFLYAFCEFDIF